MHGYDEVKRGKLMTTNMGTVVLFSSKGCGVVVESESYEVGHYSDEWDVEDFYPFDGTVTLDNN